MSRSISALANRIRFMKHALVIGVVASAVGLAGCTTTNPYTGESQITRTSAGAGIGAASGALLGQLIGGNRKATLIGAGIGALFGGGVGNYMDRQEDKLRQQLNATGVSVTRYGDQIILNMPGNVTFATSSSDINSEFFPVLDSVALVVNEYKQTYIDVIGHTDSTGSAQYNQRLSEARANSVAAYLESRNVMRERIVTRGVGPQYPVASNDTPEGRALNRRVEIVLTPVT